jgi:hypothetical protein
MRVVLKPAGLAVILLALVGMASLVVWQASNNKGGGVVGGASAPAAGAKPADDGQKLASGSVETGPVDFSKAKLVIDPTAQPWTLATQPPAQATKNEFNADDLPGDIKHAVRLSVTQVDPAKFWCAQLIKVVPQPIGPGRNLAVRFWARSKTSTPVHVVFETGDVPHEPELDKVIAFTPEWKEYTLRFKTRLDHTDVNANFCLKAGIKPGEVEISEVRVADFGS